MTAERWKRIEEVFESALELAPQERAAFLDRACDGDQELRREVDGMIAAGRDFGGAIESAIAGKPRTWPIRARHSSASGSARGG